MANECNHNGKINIIVIANGIHAFVGAKLISRSRCGIHFKVGINIDCIAVHIISSILSRTHVVSLLVFRELVGAAVLLVARFVDVGVGALFGWCASTPTLHISTIIPLRRRDSAA